MRPATFGYARPDTIEEALRLLAAENAVVLAGGQSLIPRLNDRSVTPALVVDIGRIAGLRGIESTPRGLRVGAAARLAEVACSPLVAKFPLLVETLASVATAAIRNRGTFVGNLVSASPNSELPVAAVAIDARLALRQATGERELAAGEFFLGPHRVAVAADEIAVAALLPVSDAARTGSAFVEVTARAEAPPLACVAAHLEADAAGVISKARLVAGGITGVPARCDAAETVLVGLRAADAAGRIASTKTSLWPSPVLPEAEYAAEVLPVLLRRAVGIAAARLMQAGADSPRSNA